MEVPQVAIKQEKPDSFTVKTEPNVKYETEYETQILDVPHSVPQIKLEPVKLESCSNVGLPTNLDQQLQFSEETQMIGDDGNYMSDYLLYQSQSKQEDIKLEGSEEMDIEMMDGLDNKKLKIENDELNIKDDENLTDEEQRNLLKLNQQQQQKEDAVSSSGKKIRGDNYRYEQPACTNTYQEIFTEKGHTSRHKLKCGLCMFKTAFEKNLKRHLVCAHNKPKEIIFIFKCSQCDYQTVNRQTFVTHFSKHTKNIFKCDQCDYETKDISRFQHHVLKHDQCDYQTVYKQYLKAHTLNHKNPHEVNSYKCDQCDYQTVRKGVLQLHILKHKNPDAHTYEETFG